MKKLFKNVVKLTPVIYPIARKIIKDRKAKKT
ncbi:MULTISPECIES: hypothetical protein [Bacillus]|nr:MULTISPECIES: hypothetical protein [Bacillus]ASB86853.1 hypothetical protein S101395_00298 [Bacillus sonorensis]MDR4957496.1 hypothetical protein [Bacillus sonorensis]WOV60583.1 hypothetical protein R5H20_22105 [Bacillus sp. KICET-3]WPP36475.1 hypothetical protein SK061_23360 [Bacillus sonorensis]